GGTKRIGRRCLSGAPARAESAPRSRSARTGFAGGGPRRGLPTQECRAVRNLVRRGPPYTGAARSCGVRTGRTTSSGARRRDVDRGAGLLPDGRVVGTRPLPRSRRGRGERRRRERAQWI